jgi:hypothetical protein
VAGGRRFPRSREQGTPAYLVGHYKVTSALTYEGFKRAVADARAQAKK